MDLVNETAIVAAIFAILLGLEWRYQFRSLRLGTVMLALIVLFLAQPIYVSAARRVSMAPLEERITELHGRQISDYQSGVLTLYEAIGEVGSARANIRLVTLGVLAWLACSPVLRRARYP
jgi:hypothetical protein